MDGQAEAAKVKWFVIAAAVFIVSGITSCTELGYLLRGRVADGRITRVKEYAEYRRSGSETRKAVEYDFTDDRGLRRHGSDQVDADWPATEGQSVKVQYCAGEDGASRLAGHTNLVGPVVFAVALVFLSISGYRFWGEVSEAVGSSRRPAKLRR
jgi:hypothetical protein